MLRLRTFGGLTLSVGDTALTGAATQRRRLAILAVLAVARTQGYGREKLMALLWPESDEESARHVLNQLLYAQRRLFGAPQLVTGRKTLRLDPAMIWTDVGAFEGALERDALEDAVSVYGGPFLDGFHLGGSTEFEEWAERQRQRLARLHRTALVTLAERASASGDPTKAESWLRLAFELEPLDVRTVSALVRSLAARGDVAGARRAARAYDDALWREIGPHDGHAMKKLLGELGLGT